MQGLSAQRRALTKTNHGAENLKRVAIAVPLCSLGKGSFVQLSLCHEGQTGLSTSGSVLRVQIGNNCCCLAPLNIKKSCFESFCWTGCASSRWRSLSCSLPGLTSCLPFLQSLCRELMFSGRISTASLGLLIAEKFLPVLFSYSCCSRWSLVLLHISAVPEN